MADEIKLTSIEWAQMKDNLAGAKNAGIIIFQVIDAIDQTIKGKNMSLPEVDELKVVFNDIMGKMKGLEDRLDYLPREE